MSPRRGPDGPGAFLLECARDLVGSAHVCGSVVALVGFCSTGNPLLLGAAVVAGGFAAVLLGGADAPEVKS